MRRLPLAAALGILTVMLIRTAPVEHADASPVFSTHAIEASLAVPASVETILSRSCRDCHSNDPRGPWYSKIAPFSWIFSDEMARARAALNLSEWPVTEDVKPKAAIGQLTSACAEVESKRMPPAAYARLRLEEIETLCEWTGEQTRLLRKQALRQKKG